MTVNTYNVGDQAVLQALFSNPASTTPPVDPATGFSLVNPTTVTCELRRPDGTEVSLPVTVSGTSYTATTVTLDKPGIWWYRFVAGGNFIGAAENALQVRDRYT